MQVQGQDSDTGAMWHGEARVHLNTSQTHTSGTQHSFGWLVQGEFAKVARESIGTGSCCVGDLGHSESFPAPLNPAFDNMFQNPAGAAWPSELYSRADRAADCEQ